MTNQNNPQFDDFLQMDVLDSSNADLFSLFFNNEDLNAPSTLDSTMQDMGNQLDLDVFGSVNTFQTVGDPTTAESISNISANSDINHSKQEEQNDIQLLLAMNRQLQERLEQQQELYRQSQQQLRQDTVASTSVETTSAIDTSNSALVAQLITPSIPETQSITSIETAAAATADAQIAVLIDSSKNAAAVTAAATATVINKPTAVAPTSTSTKRPSPEPAPAARKIARTEPVDNKPSTSVPTTSSTEASTTINSSTSPINTTLSAATLQFLLQQQIQTPLVPKLFTGKLTREEIEETLAKLLESTRHLLLASQESTLKEESPAAESDDEMEKDVEAEKAGEQPAGQTHGLKTQPGIKTDDIPSSTDLKKMTSKERRQLRNKISARNFRVRRKEYIGQLEGQVEQHKTEARHLREAVTVVYEENKRLKEELEEVKRQLTQTTISNASMTISPQQSISMSGTGLTDESKSLLAAILTRPPLNPSAKNLTLTSTPTNRPQPILPNLNKDVPYSSSVDGRAWKDKNPVYVLKTLVPEVYIGDQLQFGPKSTFSKEDEMWDRPWLNTDRVPKELSKIEKNPFLVSGVVYELMQTFATMTLHSMPLTEVASISSALVQEDTKATVQDYESDKQMGEALEWEMQKDLCNQVQSMSLSSKFDMEGDEIPAELLQILFGISSQTSPSQASINSTQEDPNMMEWLYESFTARLVDLDLQNAQDQQIFLQSSEVQYA
ncbi:hypothetical protein BGZ49_007520 [Haplosporangium sp. Z 27]|nr:hypothetical protein BGZ49_007520 [Haplosporangium sp. Z 27]